MVMTEAHRRLPMGSVAILELLKKKYGNTGVLLNLYVDECLIVVSASWSWV